jgi:hypothetical protein
MAWKIDIEPRARDDLRGLGSLDAQRDILWYLNAFLANEEKPWEYAEKVLGPRGEQRHFY